MRSHSVCVTLSPTHTRTHAHTLADGSINCRAISRDYGLVNKFMDPIRATHADGGMHLVCVYVSAYVCDCADGGYS